VSSLNFNPPKAVLPLSFKYFAKFLFVLILYLESLEKSSDNFLNSSSVGVFTFSFATLSFLSFILSA